MKGIELTFNAAQAFIYTALLNCVNGKMASSKDKKKNVKQLYISGKSKQTSESRTLSLPWRSLPQRNQSRPATVMLEGLPAVSPR